MSPCGYLTAAYNASWIGRDQASPHIILDGRERLSVNILEKNRHNGPHIHSLSNYSLASAPSHFDESISLSILSGSFWIRERWPLDSCRAVLRPE